MIRNGRAARITGASVSFPLSHQTIPKKVRLTAILGTLIFSAFLFLSVGRIEESPPPSTGVHQVISSDNSGTLSDGDSTSTVGDTHTSVQEDGSLWAYFESLLRHLLLGE